MNLQQNPTIDIERPGARNEVDLAILSEHLVGVVEETMQPASVSLWLRPPANHQAPWRATPSVPSEDEARDER
jgi:hypothetical protein